MGRSGGKGVERQFTRSAVSEVNVELLSNLLAPECSLRRAARLNPVEDLREHSTAKELLERVMNERPPDVCAWLAVLQQVLCFLGEIVYRANLGKRSWQP